MHVPASQPSFNVSFSLAQFQFSLAQLGLVKFGQVWFGQLSLYVLAFFITTTSKLIARHAASGHHRYSIPGIHSVARLGTVQVPSRHLSHSHYPGNFKSDGQQCIVNISQWDFLFLLFLLISGITLRSYQERCLIVTLSTDGNLKVLVHQKAMLVEPGPNISQSNITLML